MAKVNLNFDIRLFIIMDNVLIIIKFNLGIEIKKIN